MRAEHKITLRLEPNEDGRTHLEITVYQAAGGINYATYKTEPRGIYLSVTPVKIVPAREPGGFSSVEFGAFTGLKHLLEENTRLNRKRLDAVAAETFAAIRAGAGTAFDVVKAVCAKNNLTLAEPLVQAAVTNR